MRRITLLLATVGIALGLAGCTSAETPKPPSTACDVAFSVASDAMNRHYATHPMFGPEYDALYEDGIITDEEQPTLDAMIDDEEAAYNAAIAPIYIACGSVEDLYAGAFAHREDADWAVIENEYMTRDEIKKDFIVSHCHGNTDRPACSDFAEDDWR